GATAYLKSYNNSTKVWIVDPIDGDFTEDEAVTIQAGKGAGTLEEQEVHKGPYSIDSLIAKDEEGIPCRKVIGVTSVTDEQIYGSSSIDDSEGDYGMQRIKDLQRDFWELGRINYLRKTFTFVSTPSTTDEHYRWVYFRAAPDIEDIDDNDSVIVPEELHQAVLFEGIIALADKAIYANPDADQKLGMALNTFWEAMEDPHT